MPCLELIVFEHVREIVPEGPEELPHELVPSFGLKLSEELVSCVNLRKVKKEGSLNVVLYRVIELFRQVFATRPRGVELTKPDVKRFNLFIEDILQTAFLRKKIVDRAHQ